MTRLERLEQLTGIPAEVIEEKLDKGMWDIIIELNSKGYKTVGCCEGHLNDKGEWIGYVGFIYPYKFNVYPKNFASMKKRKFYYWDGKGEDKRQEFLDELYRWAMLLPIKEPIDRKVYTLYGKNKNRTNSKEKVLISTNEYEDIKAILNRRDMNKYKIRLVENVVERY